jgi:hypothetical protein
MTRKKPQASARLAWLSDDPMVPFEIRQLDSRYYLLLWHGNGQIVVTRRQLESRKRVRTIFLDRCGAMLPRVTKRSWRAILERR